jgi:hypothetical protein
MGIRRRAAPGFDHRGPTPLADDLIAIARRVPTGPRQQFRAFCLDQFDTRRALPWNVLLSQPRTGLSDSYHCTKHVTVIYENED